MKWDVMSHVTHVHTPTHTHTHTPTHVHTHTRTHTHTHMHTHTHTHMHNEIHSWMNTLQYDTTIPTSVANRPRVYKGTAVLVRYLTVLTMSPTNVTIYNFWKPLSQAYELNTTSIVVKFSAYVKQLAIL